MESKDMLVPPYMTLLQFAASRIGQRPHPNFTLDEATKAAEASGYKVGAKKDGTKKGVQNALRKLCAEGLLERPMRPTGRPVQGQYLATARGVFRVIGWLDFVSRANAVRGKDVSTTRSADRPDFLARMGPDPRLHVWTQLHLMPNPDVSKGKVSGLQADSALSKAMTQAWEDIERAAKDFARRSEQPLPGFAVVMQFNPARVARVRFSAQDAVLTLPKGGTASSANKGAERAEKAPKARTPPGRRES